MANKKNYSIVLNPEDTIDTMNNYLCLFDSILKSIKLQYPDDIKFKTTTLKEFLIIVQDKIRNLKDYKNMTMNPPQVRTVFRYIFEKQFKQYIDNDTISDLPLGSWATLDVLNWIGIALNLKFNVYKLQPDSTFVIDSNYGSKESIAKSIEIKYTGTNHFSALSGDKIGRVNRIKEISSIPRLNIPTISELQQEDLVFRGYLDITSPNELDKLIAQVPEFGSDFYKSDNIEIKNAFALALVSKKLIKKENIRSLYHYFKLNYDKINRLSENICKISKPTDCNKYIEFLKKYIYMDSEIELTSFLKKFPPKDNIYMQKYLKYRSKYLALKYKN